jgi:hypothetical protein
MAIDDAAGRKAVRERQGSAAQGESALVIAGIIAILVAAGVDIAGYLGFEQDGAADGLS